jgi:hypothetical protein
MEPIQEFIIPEEVYAGEQVVREACRAVIFDENNMMPLIYVAKQKHHKLP